MLGHFQFNFFSLALIASAAFAFLLAIWILRKRGQVFKWFSAMLSASAWWAMSYGFELASSDLQSMLFWIRIESPML